MIELVPRFISDRQKFEIGESNMKFAQSRPLNTGFTTLFICEKGWAVVRLYNKRFLFREGDILNAYWDMCPIFEKISEDFLSYYCMMSEEFCYQIYRNMSVDFCNFAYQYPVMTPTKEQHTQLALWLKENLWLTENLADMRLYTTVKNNLENLYIVIDSESQKILKRSPAPSMPRAWEILREFGSLLIKYAEKEHSVAFYANKINITPYYLSSVTRDTLKETPKSLIDKQIISIMKPKLSTTGDSLKMIAENLNFDDVSYMCRFFRRHTGMSMLEYRKRYKT